MHLQSIRKAFLTYRKDTKASTALEFGLLTFPFILIIIALIELSLFFATTTVLEGALVDVTRSIRVGAIQEEASVDAMRERFVDEVCAHAGYLASCDEIQYEVRKLDEFGSNIDLNISDEGVLVDPPFEIEGVTAGCVVMVRLAYGYEFMTPFFGRVWSNYPDNKRLILSTTVVKTEPYDFYASDNCEIS